MDPDCRTRPGSCLFRAPPKASLALEPGDVLLRFVDVVKKAQLAGAEALGHVARFQNAAVGALGFARRDQIQDLTREGKRLAKKAGQPTRET